MVTKVLILLFFNRCGVEDSNSNDSTTDVVDAADVELPTEKPNSASVSIFHLFADFTFT